MCPCICDLLSWEKFAWVSSEILRLFVNTVTANNKYSRCYVNNFAQKVQTPLPQKEKAFPDFLLHFWNVHEIWKFEKKVSIIA